MCGGTVTETVGSVGVVVAVTNIVSSADMVVKFRQDADFPPLLGWVLELQVVASSWFDDVGARV